MTNKKRAEELIKKMFHNLKIKIDMNRINEAKQCAITSVDEQIEFIKEEMIQINFDIRTIWIDELNEIKQEIERYDL